jgi:DNA-binding transcriptional ArsR family regulator/uncharacterized protein YndB with AHSA1/START domain
MDAIFRALGDPGRRRLLDRLNQRNGLTLTELCEGMGMTRQSVTKHLSVLEAAGLVTTLRQGREKLHYLNAAPINDIADRWMHSYDRTRAAALSDLKTALEATTPMETTDLDTTDLDSTGHTTDGSTFVYSTYIQATPERVWHGLTDPAFTTRYWRHPKSGGVTMTTDWQKGSSYDMAYGEHALVISDPEQVVLESDAYRRLSYTWHTFTPELAERFGWSDERQAKISSEPRSKVTFELEPVGDQVKLTVVHDDLQAGSEVVTLISGGWPIVVSRLKTLLERTPALTA